MPQLSNQSLEIFGWVAGAIGLVFIGAIPVAYLLADLVEVVRLRRSGLL
jgi:hypothetical protein